MSEPRLSELVLERYRDAGDAGVIVLLETLRDFATTIARAVRPCGCGGVVDHEDGSGPIAVGPCPGCHGTGIDGDPTLGEVVASVVSLVAAWNKIADLFPGPHESDFILDGPAEMLPRLVAALKRERDEAIDLLRDCIPFIGYGAHVPELVKRAEALVERTEASGDE